MSDVITSNDPVQEIIAYLETTNFGGEARRPIIDAIRIIADDLEDLETVAGYHGEVHFERRVYNAGT